MTLSANQLVRFTSKVMKRYELIESGAYTDDETVREHILARRFNQGCSHNSEDGVGRIHHHSPFPPPFNRPAQIKLFAEQCFTLNIAVNQTGQTVFTLFDSLRLWIIY